MSDTQTPPPYPLAWPDGLPRTGNRREDQFRSTIAKARDNVRDSLRRLGVDTGRSVSKIVLTSNIGGLDPGQPDDPGVAVWFLWDGSARCIAVDRYSRVEANLQAIHHIVEARRTEYRHGGLTMLRASFAGITLLPGTRSIALPAPRGWREVLGFKPGAKVTHDEAKQAFMALPNTVETIEAWQAAKKELSA